MPLSLHAATVCVSAKGDVVVTIAPAPDARYSAPETHFGFSPCVVWSLACLLFKLITGSSLVRSRVGAARASLLIVGTLRANGTRFGELFDALDASVRWKNRAPRFRMPQYATSAERTVLTHALQWSRRVRISAGGVFLVDTLAPVLE